ncbi:MAG: hypothetical protein NTW29_02645 [Bacteroidetes bacterium]|nr:hypothetical protein [Bacteroidota bacterium]
MNARLLIRLLLHCVLPLVIGFAIYYFFRPEVAVIRWTGHHTPLIPVSEMNDWQRLLVFSGPDFCWSYSLSAALFIWQKAQDRPLPYFTLFVFLIILLSELLQGWALPGFTLDWADLIAALSAFGLSWMFKAR